MPTEVDSQVISKSLALLEKIKRRVEQIDDEAFPTASTEDARILLLSVLDEIASDYDKQGVSPVSLYNSLINLRAVVANIESSNSDDISWPLVSYCDFFWKKFFPGAKPQIFYTITGDHNYYISSFTNKLRTILEPIMPHDRITHLLQDRMIYCLEMPSIETENLPLYANVGHEFGHAVFEAKSSEIEAIIADEIMNVFTAMTPMLLSKQSPDAVRRASKIITKAATELFCDLVGILISGPASVLSLYEMGWGADQTHWQIVLAPDDSHIKTYPSIAFRIEAAKIYIPGDEFAAELKTKLKETFGEESRLTEVYDRVLNIPDNSDIDSLSVSPKSDRDFGVIAQAFLINLSDLKKAFKRMLVRFKRDILSEYFSAIEFAPITSRDISELLIRLNADILPNIIPNSNLLGEPAKFSAILNACALFRLHMLQSPHDGEGIKEVSHKLQKIERLTAKALEVSYVQQNFKLWKSA